MEVIRDNGFEWLFRLLQEPRRLAYRYLVLYPQALPSLMSWIRQMRQRRIPAFLSRFRSSPR